MIVETRQKDIGIIKSCGMGSFSVLGIFTGFGVCVGVAGSAFGILLGYIVTRNINVIENLLSVVLGLKVWKSSVYMLEKIPDQVQWHSVLPIVIAAVAASAVGALIPAIIAARTRPAVILRYE